MQLVSKTLPDLSPGLSWLTVDETHKRDGRTIRRIRQLCERRWSYTGEAVLAKPEWCHKPQWFVRSDRVKSAGPVEIAAKPTVDPGKLSDGVLCKLGEKSILFREWQDKIKAAIRFHGPNAQRLTQEQVTQRFVAECRNKGIKISARTLQRMEKKVEGNGTAALIDGRSIREGGVGAVPVDDPFMAFVREKYMTQEGLSARYCHKIACHKAEEKGWRTWSVRQVQEFTSSIPWPQRVYARDGKKAYEDKCEQYIERDWEPVRANEQWGSDHHELDLFVRIGETLNKETGEVKYRNARPWLTLWIDNGSRKVMGWDLYVGDPCTDNIILSFRRAIVAYGVPETVYVDNGKDYDSFALHGRTKKERFRKHHIDGRFLFGTFALADVEAHNVHKYHGQSKLIERFFGTMEGQFCRMFDSYCGNSPANRPEGLQERLNARKAPTLEEVKEAFVAWVELYNAAPHTGQGMHGKCPNEIYAEKLDVKRTADEAMLHHFSQKYARPVKVTQNGVKCNNLGYGKSNEILRSLMGQKVVVGFDPENLHRVAIYTLDGVFKCAADINERLPGNATAAMLKATIKKKRHGRKIELEYRKVRPHIRETTVELMFREADAVRAAEKKRTETNPPTPPTYRPVRSPFENQLGKIEQAMRAPVLRKAAGAESIDLLQFANENLDFQVRKPEPMKFDLIKAINDDAATDGSNGGSQ